MSSHRCATALVLLALASLLVGACSSGATGGASRAGEGAPCASGAACTTDLICFIPGPDPSGTCVRPPAACGGKSSCDRACTDAVAQGCASFAGCEGGRNTGYTVACVQPASRQEGQSCSVAARCEQGLLCFVPTPGKVGACEKLPAGCGASAACTCVPDTHSRCSSGSTCEGGTDGTVLACL